jgi:monovalent cation:H+ antiporter-2, CPA2 family
VTSIVNINAYSDALVFLGTACILVPLLSRSGLSPILGYLGAGALLGPLGLGSLAGQFPPFYWVTVAEAGNVAGIAELGVVFLLFRIGLGLSLTRLTAMRRFVLGMGGLQVLLTASLLAGLAAAAGQKPAVAIILGACLSLSSTAIVLELLSRQGRLATSAGRASFAVLLAQDLAVIPLLVFISILSTGSGKSLIESLSTALVQAAIAITFIIILGRFLLRPLFQLVASAGSSELFVAAVLFVIVGAAVIAHQAGLSMAIGAFVAGLMLAETEYSKAIEATVEPFKGLLLGAFFFTVGMNIEFREFLRDPIWLLAAALFLIAIKSLVMACLGRLFRLSWPATIETSLLLATGGEFAFVGIGLASGMGLMEPNVTAFWLAVTSLTMALTPLLPAAARLLTAILPIQPPADPELAARPPVGERHAIVVGYGRVGKVVCSLLREHGIQHIATDCDAGCVARSRREGKAVYYGDAADSAFLDTCGLLQATAVIITIHTRDAIDEVVARVRAVRPEILIVSRARDAEHARHLYGIGATDAVPETVEASLQLSEAALVGLGVAAGPAIASIHEKRAEFRCALQQAAGGRRGRIVRR